jgi:hypothetical protein
MCALVSLLGSNVLFAADAPAAAAPTGTVQERLTALEAKTDAPGLWKTLGFQIRGGVSATYARNFHNPETNLNQLHTETAETNTFSPRLAQVIVERVPSAEGSAATDRVGFRARLNFGADARVSRARTNYLPGQDNTELDVQELYAQYIAPIGSGLTIGFGKFNTMLGYETFTSWENPNLTRTFNYNLAQAFTNTGVRLTYQVNPMVGLLFGVYNGWDNPQDNNQSVLLEGAVTLTNFDGRLTNYFYTSWGPEQSNGRGGAGVNGALGGTSFPGNTQFCGPGFKGTPGCDPSAKRFVLDYIMTGKVTDKDTIILEIHYGNESNASFSRAAAGQSPNARWNAAILYLNHDFDDQWSLRLRNEFFEDAGGARTCTGGVNFNAGNNSCGPTFVLGTPQGLYSSTNTLEYRVTPQLITRTEFRYDKSNKSPFLDGSRPSNNQETLFFNVVYLF